MSRVTCGAAAQLDPGSAAVMPAAVAVRRSVRRLSSPCEWSWAKRASLDVAAAHVEELVGLQEEGEDDGAVGRVGVVPATGGAPHVVAGRGDTLVIGERALQHVA